MRSADSDVRIADPTAAAPSPARTVLRLIMGTSEHKSERNLHRSRRLLMTWPKRAFDGLRRHRSAPLSMPTRIDIDMSFTFALLTAAQEFL
jgi:hypothetical protein